MRIQSTKKLVLNGVMIALVFLATYFTRIPTPLPGGYFNLGDAVILVSAVFLGPLGGLAAGAIGSGLADLAAGALLFAPITFVVKGLEGLIVGLLAVNCLKTAKAGIRLLCALVVGAFIMVAGYFLAEAYLLGLFNSEFGLTAAVAELLPNGIQGTLSVILGYILILLLAKLDRNVNN